MGYAAVVELNGAADAARVHSLVGRNIEASVFAIGGDATSIDDVFVGRGDGNVKQAGSLGNEGVALHRVAIGGVAGQSIGSAADVDLAFHGSHDGVALSLDFIGATRESFIPCVAIVGRILQTRIRGNDQLTVGAHDFVHERPFCCLIG